MPGTPPAHAEAAPRGGSIFFRETGEGRRGDGETERRRDGETGKDGDPNPVYPPVFPSSRLSVPHHPPSPVPRPPVPLPRSPRPRSPSPVPTSRLSVSPSLRLPRRIRGLECPSPPMNGQTGTLGRWCISRGRCLFSALYFRLSRVKISEPAAPNNARRFDAADLSYQSGNFEEAATQYASLRDISRRRENEENIRAAPGLAGSLPPRSWRNKDLPAEFEPLMKMRKDILAARAGPVATFGLLSARGAQYEHAIAEGRRGLEIARATGDGSLAGVCYDTS